ncbi:hypothetical protein C8R45DRAFT_935525 [Mycena sanguinolenta]|nr:hypothetical protein C8R45DRAFT_935525 [Mycena sanguinolenta]
MVELVIVEMLCRDYNLQRTHLGFTRMDEFRLREYGGGCSSPIAVWLASSKKVTKRGDFLNLAQIGNFKASYTYLRRNTRYEISLWCLSCGFRMGLLGTKLEFSTHTTCRSNNSPAFAANYKAVRRACFRRCWECLEGCPIEALKLEAWGEDLKCIEDFDSGAFETTNLREQTELEEAGETSGTLKIRGGVGRNEGNVRHLDATSTIVESAVLGRVFLHTSNDSALLVWLENEADDVKNADENVMACKLRMIGRYKTRTYSLPYLQAITVGR